MKTKLYVLDLAYFSQHCRWIGHLQLFLCHPTNTRPFLKARNLKQELKTLIFINTFPLTLQRIVYCRVFCRQTEQCTRDGFIDCNERMNSSSVFQQCDDKYNLCTACHVAEMSVSHEYIRQNQPEYRWSVSLGNLFSRALFVLL